MKSAKPKPEACHDAVQSEPSASALHLLGSSSAPTAPYISRRYARHVPLRRPEIRPPTSQAAPSPSTPPLQSCTLGGFADHCDLGAHICRRLRRRSFSSPDSAIGTQSEQRTFIRHVRTHWLGTACTILDPVPGRAAALDSPRAWSGSVACGGRLSSNGAADEGGTSGSESSARGAPMLIAPARREGRGQCNPHPSIYCTGWFGGWVGRRADGWQWSCRALIRVEFASGYIGLKDLCRQRRSE